MKKLLLLFSAVIKSYFIQTLLAFVGYYSWLEVEIIGKESTSVDGTFSPEMYQGKSMKYQTLSATDVAITSGFNGGALAMGLICCTCIIIIGLLEIKKFE